MKTISNLVFAFLLTIVSKTDSLTLYDYYTNGSIGSGLRPEGDVFLLNGKPITIFSGSFHYFRTHPSYWRPILKKMKAAGLNAVDFYSPWNLHEEVPGQFDFETGFLNLSDFLEAIREADLFAIFRPGPFICAEWDFGGLPSWLLRDPNMKIRSNYSPYLDAVDNYWRLLIQIAKEFQFSLNGGPIIAVQIENELGSYGNTKTNTSDAIYMKTLGDIAYKHGMRELFITSDGPGKHGSLDIYFKGWNFNKNSLKNLQDMKKAYPDQPLFVGEYWSGWFDNWGGRHNTQNITYFTQQFQQIVFQMNSSINLYMFFGGTNYGFMAGNVGKPDPGALTASVITSYDYDAPLSESGNYTPKYWRTQRLIEMFNTERNLTQLERPEPPAPHMAVGYGVLLVNEQLRLDRVLESMSYPAHLSEQPVSMENINIGYNYGQNFGFTLYRTKIPKSNSIKFTKGRVNDRAAVVVDGRQIDFIYSKNTSFSLSIPSNVFTKRTENKYTLDLLVENMGRVDYGPTLNDLNIQRKGIQESILIDNKIQTNWQLFALDFKTQFIEQLKEQNWELIGDYKSPTFYRTKLIIKGEPSDTYLLLPNWTTSVVFINGFNIGRYWNVGPAKTLYVSAPLLRTGVNEIIIFETQKKGFHIEFCDKPILQ